jgi:hypothetical protein
MCHSDYPQQPAGKLLQCKMLQVELAHHLTNPVLHAGLCACRYKQQDGGASVPVLLVGYAGQAGGLHGLRLYRVAAQ